MLYDRARVFVEGGRGGDGVVSFRREAHVPKGGPDGGDGGPAATSCSSATRRAATSRRCATASTCAPAAAAMARASAATARAARIARSPSRPAPSRRGSTARASTSLEPGQRAVVAHGGGGGSGNKRFATSTRQAPRFAERGLEGESGWIELRLKLLADAGLVGLPERRQVVAARAADPRRAQGRRLPVHDDRARARHARGRRPPARARRHPGPDRGRRRGRRARPRVPRPRRALRAARARRRRSRARRPAPRPTRPCASELGAYGARARGSARARRALEARPRRPTSASTRPSRGGASASATARSTSLAVSSATGAGIEELRARDPRRRPRAGLARGGGRRGAGGAAIRGRAPRLHAGGRAAASSSSGLATASSASRAAASSCSCAVTTSPTPRRSPTWSSACARSAWSAGFAAGLRARRRGPHRRRSPSSSTRPRHWPSGPGRVSPVAHRAPRRPISIGHEP